MGLRLYLALKLLSVGCNPKLWWGNPLWVVSSGPRLGNAPQCLACSQPIRCRLELNISHRLAMNYHGFCVDHKVQGVDFFSLDYPASFLKFLQVPTLPGWIRSRIMLTWILMNNACLLTTTHRRPKDMNFLNRKRL